MKHFLNFSMVVIISSIFLISGCSKSSLDEDKVMLISETESKSNYTMELYVDKFINENKDTSLEVVINDSTGKEVSSGEVSMLVGMEMGHMKNLELEKNEHGIYQTKTKFDMSGDWFGLITYKNDKGKKFKSEKQEFIVN